MMTHPIARVPASEKRQGTKSQWVMVLRCRGRYEDLTAWSRLRRLDRSDCCDRFAEKAVEHVGEDDRTALLARRLTLRWRQRERIDRASARPARNRAGTLTMFAAMRRTAA